METARILPIPQPLFEPLRRAAQDLPLHYTWSNNHDTEPFTYFYYNLCGTTDANRMDTTMNLLEHPRGGCLNPIRDFWQHLRTEIYPGAKLLRMIAFVHTWDAVVYPHISLGGRPGDRTIVAYLNKTWERDWEGMTFLGDLVQPFNSYLPTPGTMLDYPADWASYCLPSKKTKRSRVSLVVRLTP